MSLTKLTIVAGGTGGHVYPALAVAEELLALGVEVTWMGTQRGLEARVVPARNIFMDWIDVAGVRGNGLIRRLRAPFMLLGAVWQALRILRKQKPSAVLGMGGYVAGPGGIAAWLLRVPLIVHEQNAVAGLTNKYLARFATRVLSGFRLPAGLPRDTRWVGNPVRSEIAKLSRASLSKKRDDGTIKVLVLGGSQGARSLNEVLPEQFAKSQRALNEQSDIRLSITHQCGRGSLESVKEHYQRAEAVSPLDVNPVEFIDDMAGALARTDVIVARAGAMTIAEIGAAGLPSILVPYPFSAGDHQERNAEYMVSAGAAIKIMNDELGGEKLAVAMDTLFRNSAMRAQMSAQARTTFRPSALEDLVAVCQEVMHA